MSPSFHDKYNTLPAGSAALYRGMFTASRSPLNARSTSLRLQQDSPAVATEVLIACCDVYVVGSVVERFLSPCLSHSVFV